MTDSVPVQILVVDDSRVIRRAAFKILEKEYDVLEAEDGVDAWEQIQQNRNISVVFTDLDMPNMNGYQLLEKIRSSEDPDIAKLPVIVITGASESDGAKQRVFECGATDFISKPFDSISLRSRAQAHVNYRSEVQALEQRVATDKLTGLYTVAAFRQQGEQALAYARRHSTSLTVARFEVEQFADIFVKYGKDVAEQILVKVASIIREVLRKEDSAARLGVAKFGLLLTCADGEGATHAVMRICRRVSSLKLKLGNEAFQVRINTGMTSPEISEDDSVFESLMGDAEHALQQALKQGDGKIVLFQTGKSIPACAHSFARVDVNVEDMLQEIEDGNKDISQQQLASALHKLIPLIERADQQLKLGLAKVVLHLKKKLK